MKTSFFKKNVFVVKISLYTSIKILSYPTNGSKVNTVPALIVVFCAKFISPITYPFQKPKK